MKVPKTASTRFILPRGVAGSEPANADEGTLSYDPAGEVVRVKTASGWQDVGSGGGGGAPSGPAGGDLGGTYPNPSVVRAEGLKSATTTVSVSGAAAPTTGQALVATSSTAASWQTLSTSPTGAAGGDLGGTYPNPSVAKLTTTTGPTSLTIGAVADGQALIRSGSTVVGANLVALSDRPGFPYLAKPAAPDAWDLEARDMTDPDLLNNGWAIHALLSPWTVYTRTGNIDLSTNPAANTYRSELRDGVLLVQLPLSAAVVVSKATNNNAFTYASRAWASDHYSSLSASGGVSDFGLADNTHRDAVGARTYYTGIEGINQLEFLLVGPSTFTGYQNNAINNTNLAWDTIKYVHNTASGGIMGSNQRHPTSGNMQIGTSTVFTNRTVSITTTHAVMWWQIINRGALIHFDFIRRLPLYGF